MPLAFEPARAGGRGKGGDGQGASGKDKDGSGTGSAGRSCPICGKPSQQATRPFCSKGCRNVDLNRWLSGTYVVPGSESEDEGSE